MAYDNSFFDIIRPGCQSSAKIVVPEVIGRLGSINKVIDIGCGEGWWVHEFGKFGATTYGVDNEGCDSPNKADLDFWIRLDIENIKNHAFYIDHIFDLAICLEVVEHLTEQSSELLIDLLCSASDNVLFSAAIPKQGGLGHINEQWPNYWIHKFNHRQYQGTEFGIEFWGNPEVEPWYQQNMFLFQKVNRTNMQHFYPAIHPAFWSTRTGAPLP